MKCVLFLVLAGKSLENPQMSGFLQSSHPVIGIDKKYDQSITDILLTSGAVNLTYCPLKAHKGIVLDKSFFFLFYKNDLFFTLKIISIL